MSTESADLPIAELRALAEAGRCADTLIVAAVNNLVPLLDRVEAAEAELARLRMVRGVLLSQRNGVDSLCRLLRDERDEVTAALDAMTAERDKALKEVEQMNAVTKRYDAQPNWMHGSLSESIRAALSKPKGTDEAVDGSGRCGTCRDLGGKHTLRDDCRFRPYEGETVVPRAPHVSPKLAVSLAQYAPPMIPVKLWEGDNA